MRTDIHRDTIMRLGVRVGEGCAELHDRMMRDLQVPILEFDEIWGFVEPFAGLASRPEMR